MRWEGQRESSNIEDRRGGGDGGGGGVGLPIGRGGIGLGTIVIALVAGWIFGINPLTLLGVLGGDGQVEIPTQQAPQGATHGTPEDAGGKFVAVVLASTEDVWNDVFRKGGAQYRSPQLVLYSGRTRTACGLGESAAGPFYCPGDQKVYIDLAFYKLMRDRLGAPGEAAQAYVVAHEIGHHVQNLLGTMEKVDAARSRANEAQANAISVRLELQADCYAGVWAARSQQARGWLDQSDLESVLNAASAIGDDTLQRRSQGVVVPESFTHGSSAQRVKWFRAGAQSGDLGQCDTFSTRNL
jgi:predicted metalloprotease